MSVLKNFQDTINHREPDEIPVAFWGFATYVPNVLGIKNPEYYTNIEIKLKIQMDWQRRFPNVMMMPGTWPDWGVVVEPAGFGCSVVWPDEDGAPQVRPAITDINQAYHMKSVNVKTDGLFPQIIKEYEYIRSNLPEEMVEKYGYLNEVFFLGPAETAALVRGYGEFLMDLVINPQAAHHLLKMTTATIIEWLHEIERHFGSLKRVSMCEHFGTNVSPAMFEEFCFPYDKQVFDEFPNAIKLYHNEGFMHPAAYRKIPDMGADIFHLGVNLKEAKREIGERITLMGNLHPIETLLIGTAEGVYQASLEAIKDAGTGGGFILCTAGGPSIGTPPEYIDMMIKAAQDYARQGAQNG